jgi:hypothetical protein
LLCFERNVSEGPGPAKPVTALHSTNRSTTTSPSRSQKKPVGGRSESLGGQNSDRAVEFSYVAGRDSSGTSRSKQDVFIETVRTRVGGMVSFCSLPSSTRITVCQPYGRLTNFSQRSVCLLFNSTGFPAMKGCLTFVPCSRGSPSVSMMLRFYLGYAAGLSTIARIWYRLNCRFV